MAKNEPKTKPTSFDIDDYLAARGTPDQIADSKQLIALLSEISGE
jgi:hypothetical protein